MTRYTKVENGVTMVAVLYSPGYGSGWYTWNTEYPDLVFEPKVVEWVLNGKPETQLIDLENYLSETYPDIYIGSNLEKLCIEWVPEGTAIRIFEYDGNEAVQCRDKMDWIVT